MQKITSAETSINKTKVPALFKRSGWTAGDINLDIGGGKFDTATDYLAKWGVVNVIYDPYNRGQVENDRAMALVSKHAFDTVTLSNVLNVIKEPAEQEKVLRLAYEALQERRGIQMGGYLYITVYEGDKSGRGRVTPKGFQHNKRLVSYLRLVKKVFGDGVWISKGMIIAVK